MIIRSIVRKSQNWFACTLFRRDRDKIRNIEKGDILLLKFRNKEFIRKVQEDFIISLPNELKIEENEEIELDILKHIKPDEGIKRPTKVFRNNEVDIKHFIPLKTVYDQDIFVIDDNESIFVWSPHHGINHIHINRFVNKEGLFETIGLLWGDGSTEGIRSIRFTNSDTIPLNHIIKFFESMGIEKEIWKSQIIWSGPERPTEIVKDKCKEFWSRKLDLPKENVKSVLWSKSKRNETKFGSNRIFIDNFILFEIFIIGILEWYIDKIKNGKLDSEILQSVARGILSSEGCVSLFNGIVRCIGVSFDPHSNEEKLFRILFHSLGISTSIKHDSNEFPIRGWDNFLKMFLIDGFKLSENSNKKFIDGFLHHKSTLFRLKILRNIKQNESIKKETLQRLMRSNLITNKEKIALSDMGELFVSKLAGLQNLSS